MSITQHHRETVVHHQIDEETPLVPKSPRLKPGLDLLNHVLIARQKKVYSAIALADIFQKVVYTTIITSFVLYAFTYLDCTYEHSLIVYFIFAVCSWITAATVNLFAEHFMIRRTAIVVGFVIYFFGVAGLTGLSAHILDGPFILRYLTVIPLYLICFGEGLCKTFVGDFGHDQFSETRLSEKLHSYTTKLYWIGHLFALVLIAFLLGIMEFASYEVGLGLCCVCLGAGFMSFCIGWSKFKRPEKSKVNVLKLLYNIITEAKAVKKSVSLKRKSGYSVSREPTLHWLDYATIKVGGRFSHAEVQEAKSFFKIFAIFLSFIPYWICNAQGYSTFIYQGFHLNKRIGSVYVPVSWIALVNIVAVLIFVQLLEKLIYPLLRRKGYSFPTSWRIMMGMFAACISMMLAGGVQLYAHKIYANNGTCLQPVGKLNMTCVSGVHILWTVPQYIFLGISEVLVGLTGLGLACKLCPGIFQKLITSVYYVMVAMGNVISVVVVRSGWFPTGEYFNRHEMVIYFFGLAGVALLGLLLFMFVQSRQDYVSASSRYNTEYESSHVEICAHDDNFPGHTDETVSSL